MSFEKYDGSSRGRKATHHPGVKIWASGKIAFNEPAVDQWLNGAEYVELFIHSELPRVGVAPADEQTRSAYTLHTYGSYTGKLLQAKALLKDLDATRPDESLSLDARYDIDRELVVIDFDPLT